MIKITNLLPYIRNLKNPICINCIHFIEYKSQDLYDYHYNNHNKNYGSCSKFGIKNLVTGEIEYDKALNCRNDKNKCGIDGKFFVEKK